jgi:phage gpG-like protein
VPIRNWTPDAIIEKALDVQELRMRKAVVFLQGKVKQLINRGQKKRRSGNRYVGLDPSKPGEPPKKLSNLLFSSISTQIIRTKREVVGVVGTNVKYARRLELGFMGTDKLGRKVYQAPRPYLRRAVLENRDAVKTILGGK